MLVRPFDSKTMDLGHLDILMLFDNRIDDDDQLGAKLLN